MHTEQFLDAILPAGNFRCVATIRQANTKKICVHKFFKTNEEAARHIAAETKKGHDVYHACATYLRPHGRDVDNVAELQSLFLDLDVGPGKGCETQAEAVAHLAVFCKGESLPAPTVVGSGRGLHVYWRLDEPLSVSRWLPLAEELKRRTQAFKLPADHGVTADAARILRPVGARNFKDPLDVREVGLGRLGAPVPLADMQRILAVRVGPSSFAARPAYLDQIPTLKVEPDYGPKPKADDVANRCAQLAAMRATRGVQPEPVWHGCIGLLAYCEDGDDKAHEWSQGDDRYDPEEVDNKLIRWGELGPTRCSYFRDCNEDLCRLCPFVGTTPIQLGRAVAAEPATGGVPEPDTAGDKGPDGSAVGGRVIPGQPQGYAVSLAGLRVCAPGGFGAPAGVEDVIISDAPIYLAEIGKGELATGALFTFAAYDPQEKAWQDIAIPGQDMSVPAALWGAFSKANVLFRDNNAFKAYIIAAQNKLRNERRSTVVWEQYGWKDDSFFYGDKLFSPGKFEPVPVRSTGEALARSRYLVSKGQFKVWQENAQLLHMAGCEPQAVALHAAFASVLMPFHTDKEGGAILSLFSNGTNQGKTTALTAAASVWGDLQGLHLLNSSTLVARGLVWAALRNLPCVYDECTKTDPGILRQMVETFTTGHDKQRGKVDATLRHDLNSWQMIMLTGGNQSLVETLNYDKGSNAQAYRILELMPQLPPHLFDSTNEQPYQDIDHRI